jgi:hypothetical protein
MVTVAVAVDVRQLETQAFPQDDPATFLHWWKAFEEEVVRGQVVEAGNSFPVRYQAGEIVFSIVAPFDRVRVDESTNFHVVAVRERPPVLRSYECRTCRAEGRKTYGPFVCVGCPDRDGRACDEHAILLPGSLRPTCPDHRPTCSCGRAARTYCANSQCRSSLAGWCEDHASAHSSDPEARYCLPCYERLFPACAEQGCQGLGSVACDHVDAAGRLCGNQTCTRHARQWQVFGPHKNGLGRCRHHADVKRLSSEECTYQILAACTIKRLPLPTLHSLRHVLLKVTGVSPGLQRTADIAWAVARSQEPAGLRLGRKLDKVKSQWDIAINESETAMTESLLALRQWLIRNGRTQAAETIVATGWVRPRRDGSTAGKLFVRCDRRYLPRPVRDQAAQVLGFNVQMDKDS